uniref:Putative ovule protein n=1 Tax=Solanum chacoense TaxID=4108 RepID=A0A0V0H0S1_SOLCH
MLMDLVIFHYSSMVAAIFDFFILKFPFRWKFCLHQKVYYCFHITRIWSIQEYTECISVTLVS